MEQSEVYRREIGGIRRCTFFWVHQKTHSVHFQALSDALHSYQAAFIPIAALHLPSFASFLGRHLLSSVAILHDQSPKLQKPFRQCLSAGPFSCLLADQDRGPLGNRDLSRFPQTEITSATTLCLLSCTLHSRGHSRLDAMTAQCLLLLACVLVLAAPGHFRHIQTLNIFKKSPSNTSASALKKTSWPRDCSEIPTGSPSDVYVIQPTGLHPIMVYCEMNVAGGGWTVIQRNHQGTEITWAESWNTYKYGFGNVRSEYWLGTEYIHQISRQKVYQVRFVIWDASNTMKFADYSLFSLEDESHGYRLTLGTYSGTAEDAMDSDNPRNVHNSMKFSTKDQDQDTYRGNCASRSGGGWWYSACYSVQLNVKGGITWGSLCNGNCKASAILIKPAPYH
ncbi:angiopoietin-related protein 2-like [Larus michahellis]|uniref:angiopoietin-related protein 2-like n=1 Tax=Larus michahellis TaxID=119627 RepID=UPI003D9B9025